MLYYNYKKPFSLGKFVFLYKNKGFFQGWIIYKKLLLVEIMVNLFISHLGLKSSLGRLNQQSSHVMIIFFIVHHLFSSHPKVYGVQEILHLVSIRPGGVRLFQEKYKKFLQGKLFCFLFWNLGWKVCQGFFRESVKNFSKEQRVVMVGQIKSGFTPKYQKFLGYNFFRKYKTFFRYNFFCFTFGFGLLHISLL